MVTRFRRKLKHSKGLDRRRCSFQCWLSEDHCQPVPTAQAWGRNMRKGFQGGARLERPGRFRVRPSRGRIYRYLRRHRSGAGTAIGIRARTWLLGLPLQKQDVCTVERLRRIQYGPVQNNGSLGPTLRAMVPSFRFTSCRHPVNEPTISIVLCQPYLSLSSCSSPHRGPSKHSHCTRTLGTMIRARDHMHPCGKYVWAEAIMASSWHAHHPRAPAAWRKVP